MPKLYVVATPIGNLEDLSPRMRAAIESADLIAAEDTRVTMKLLNHWNLHRPLISCHRHNEAGKAPQIVERMVLEDLTVALTCDAGTPGISDPGHLLVRAAWEAGIPVEPVCGPSAAITALSAAGMDAREFAFYGFLPREKKALREKLNAIRLSGIPVGIFYESPHRVLELVQTIAEQWPGCLLCVCCDLSKKFERIYRGVASEVAGLLQSNPKLEKGEYCIVADLSALPPPETGRACTSALTLMLAQMLESEVSLSEAVEEALEAGCPRNEVYRAKLKLQDLFEEG